MAQVRAFFDQELRPNPVLGRRGVIAVFTIAIAISLIVSAGFFFAGAWPVLGFFGIDILALYWAFRVIRTKGAQRERLRLDERALTLYRQQDPDHDWQQVAAIEPTWARVECRAAPTRGEVTVAHLLLCSHGQTIECGRFLPVAQKRKIADRLTIALRDRAAQLSFI